VSTIDFSGTTSTSVNRRLGAASSCSSSAANQTTVGGSFTLATPALAEITLTAKGPGLSVLALQLQATGSTPRGETTQTINEKGTTRKLLSVAAGTYSFSSTVVSASSGTNTTPSIPGASAIRFSIRVDFKAFGTAEAAANGAAAKYLTLPDSQSCA